jgi:hypothetical protein
MAYDRSAARKYGFPPRPAVVSGSSVCVAFIGRCLAAGNMPPVSGVLLYAGYALEAEAANQAGVSRYQFHRDTWAAANERRLAALPWAWVLTWE